MPIFLVYTGDPSDPLAQYVQAVEAEDEEEASAAVLGSIAVQRYEEPTMSDPPDMNRLRRGMPVWAL